MAMTAADMRQWFSARTTVDLERRPTILPFFDRSWQAELLMNEQTTIQNWNLANAAPTEQSGFTRAQAKAAWQASKELARTQIVHKWTEQEQSAVDVPNLDMIQSPVRDLEKTRAAIATQLATKIEDNTVAYLTGLTSVEIGTAFNAAANPNEGGTGPNGNAGSIRKMTLGTNTNSIDMNGVPANDTARDLIRLAIRRASTYFMRQLVLTGVGVGNQRPSGLVAFMQPELLSVFADSMEDASGGAWARPEQAAAEGPSILRTERYAGRYRGVDVVGTPALPAPAAAGTNWAFFIMTREAVAFSRSNPVIQMLTPSTNQAAPVYRLRQLVWFGRQLVNRHLIMRVEIDEGAA